MRRWKPWIWTAIVLSGALFVWVWYFAPHAPVVAKPTLREQPEVRYADHRDAMAEVGIELYEGGKSCVGCHEDEARDVFRSYHYQMQNLVDDIERHPAVRYGGKVAYNDFCGVIFWQGRQPLSFIGWSALQDPPEGYGYLEGAFIGSGCSMCHGVGMGAPPEPIDREPTLAQLENIDCLECHGDPELYPSGPLAVEEGLKVPVRTPEGEVRYAISAEQDFDQLMRRIVAVPSKDQCLLCHAFSGGGPGFKRPNLEPSLLGHVTDENQDVHLARGLACIDCHAFERHDVALRSPDTWARGSAEVPECTDCHERRHTKPLVGWILNTFHPEKVACQTCHIPRYAKKTPTDTYRDWSRVVFDPELRHWSPEIEKGLNLRPEYRWWNEKTRIAYLYPEPASVEDGLLIYQEPAGEIARRKSLMKFQTEGLIFPFKVHEARVPYDALLQKPVPVRLGPVFSSGRLDEGIEAGARVTGLEFTGGYVTMVRYMAINHGVEPAENALFCFDCHGPTVRKMPWHELGYGRFPEVVISIFSLIGLVFGVAFLYWLIRS
ncbi:cytochrome c3 family protein [Oceanithermus sp.]